MIARPSSRQLLETVRTELRTTIKHAVTDADALARLDMIDSILGSVIMRSDDEVAWLREEIAAIERAGDAVLADGADETGQVAAALAVLRANRATSYRLPDLHAEYNLAGEVLSRAVEAGSRAGGRLRRTVEEVLEERLRREVLIRGEFSLAGRI
ncbi:MAG: hypothetical protein QOC83_5607 [Pseudonocardiales bacterium]|jgi:hypothetical protein|nr:hypothetical protein [Pseudonocardiales bacterium]MDT7641319.1 hypothetical protein [Pseudonocardiales bacterium]MDT7658646.1 hypothetical protein [Pseudonocardiales bacterium]MDT7660630.1 hypothetical protein [Pseudonocardiales bacterium]MDT7678461.1 hypothetical protein [Pseudonocardiales bacterium]